MAELKTVGREELGISVNSKNGQLCSIVLAGKEFMWGAGRPEDFQAPIDKTPDAWGRSNTIMFPLVGPAKDGKIEIFNREYAMPQHGFARDLEPKIYENLSDITVFREFERVKQLGKIDYSFDFSLSECYRISNNGKYIVAEFTVRNNTDDRMPFSLGWHPAFYTDKNGRIIDNTNKKQYTIDDVFEAKALRLEGCRDISYDGDNIRINMYHGLGHTQVWSNNEAFICLEPVTGLPRKVDGEVVGNHTSYWMLPGEVKKYKVKMRPIIKNLSSQVAA